MREQSDSCQDETSKYGLRLQNVYQTVVYRYALDLMKRSVLDVACDVGMECGEKVHRQTGPPLARAQKDLRNR